MESEHDEILLFVTVPDRESSRQIATALVSHKLAACVSAISDVFSTYRWEGHVEEASEILLMIKTFNRCFKGIVELINEIHPYDIPEIIATPVTRIDERYAGWMRDVVSCTNNGDS